MFKSLLFRVVYTGILFFAILLLSNLALPEQFGVISLLILNAALLSIVTGLGADSLIMHKLGNGKWTLPEAMFFMWRSVLIQLASFVLLQISSYAFFNVSLLSNQGGFSFFFIDLMFFTGVIFTEKFIALLYSAHRAADANKLMAAIAAVYFIAVLVVYQILHPQVQYVIYFFVFHSILQASALAVLFFSKVPGSRTVQKLKGIHKMFGISSVVMLTNIVQLLAYRIDFWLINGYYSEYEVGLYAQANRFAGLLWLLPNMAAQLLIPRFASMNNEDIQKIFSTAFYTNILMFAGAVGFTFIGFTFLLKPEYSPAWEPFLLMLPGYFCWAAVIYYASFFSWQGRFRFNLFGSILCLAIIFICDILLIPKFSIHGAAAANTIAYSSVFLFYIFLLKRHETLQVGQLFTFRKNIFTQLIAKLQ